MTYMIEMLQTMAIRAKNFKIISDVVFPVSVFMMNTKNMRILIVSTSFTFGYFASFFHICSNSGKRWSAIFNFLFVATLNRTIFFPRTFGCWIRNATCLANSRFFSSFSTISIIAFIRTIFCNTNPRIENIKNFMTN